jgi:tetratricopeptide (TPR) repeat protein
MARATAQAALAGLEEHPEHLDLWMLAGRALGDCQEAAARGHWQQAVARFPDSAAVRVGYAEWLAGAGEFEAALEVLRGFPACREIAAGAVLELRMLMRFERMDEAGQLAALAERLAPADPTIVQYRALSLLGEPEALLAACDRVLTARPGHANALFFRAQALDRLGRAGEARETIGGERFISVGALDFPPGFHERLRAEILANDTLRPDPRGKSTRGGQQTDRLVRSGNIATRDLCAAIREAVEGYADALEDEHWFVRGRPESARLKAWAVVYGDTGTQEAHRHPGAWLSGVFYVGGGPARSDASGALVIGEQGGGQEPVRRIEPVPGRLVIFPRRRCTRPRPPIWGRSASRWHST